MTNRSAANIIIKHKSGMMCVIYIYYFLYYPGRGPIIPLAVKKRLRARGPAPRAPPPPALSWSGAKAAPRRRGRVIRIFNRPIRPAATYSPRRR